MVALARQPHPLHDIIPRTRPTYGVVFGMDGKFSVEVGKLPPRTLAMAIIHAIQFEEGFPNFGATGHVIDLTTGQEVVFDRNALMQNQQLVIY